MRKADLHVHTTASDGILSPSQVVDWAVKKNINAIAITDHDSILGIEEAIERSKIYGDFLVIPGIELSCDYLGEEVHILGYFIDYRNKELDKMTKNLRESRLKRGVKMIEKLRKLGINISLKDIRNLTNKSYIGRPHIARVLLKKGYVKEIGEAFDKYIGKDKPAYVRRFKPSLKGAIDIIHSSGGVAILAHPGIIKAKESIKKAIDLGVDGLEAIHSKHDDDDIYKLRLLASEYNLICTGGSDCHGSIHDDDLLLGKYVVGFKTVDTLFELSKQKYQG